MYYYNNVAGEHTIYLVSDQGISVGTMTTRAEKLIPVPYTEHPERNNLSQSASYVGFPNSFYWELIL